jgi:hypothetical protein
MKTRVSGAAYKTVDDCRCCPKSPAFNSAEYHSWLADNVVSGRGKKWDWFVSRSIAEKLLLRCSLSPRVPHDIID